MRLKLPLISIALLLIGWLAICCWQAPDNKTCRLTALDVGQGDSILIQTPDGQDMLIDGGPDDSVIDQLGNELKPSDREIELVVLTHPDDDHLTGLVSVLDRFRVQQIIASDISVETEIYQAWGKIIANTKTPIRHVIGGEKLELGPQLMMTILWPPADYQADTNDMSIVLTINCAGSTAMLTGDASMAVEEKLVAGGIDLHASLLKVGHHGSRTSTSHEFLRAVDPDIAVISVGMDNKFNHPHPATLKRLVANKIKVLRTDQLGSISLLSNKQGGWTNSQK